MATARAVAVRQTEHQLENPACTACDLMQQHFIALCSMLRVSSPDQTTVRVSSIALGRSVTIHMLAH